MFTLGVLVLRESKMGPACSQRWGKLGCKMGCKMGPSWAPSCASWAGFLSLFSLRPVAAHHRGSSRWLRRLVVVVSSHVGAANFGGSLSCFASPIGAPIGFSFALPRMYAAYAFVNVFDTPAVPSCRPVLSCFEFLIPIGAGIGPACR